MYGVVNKSLKEMMIIQFGDERWQKVLDKSGVASDSFLSMRAYDDDVTYKLAQAAADELEILRVFERWIFRRLLAHGIRCQFTEAGAVIAGAYYALANRYLSGWYLPAFSCCRHQHGPRAGTGFTHLFVGISDSR